MNEERQVLLPLLAALGAIPALLLLASIRREALGAAARRLAAAIAAGFGFARGRLPRVLAAAGAILVLCALLFGLAAFLNERGDDLMPAVSRLAGHFGDPRVAWIHDHDRDWTRFKNDFRAAWTRARPGDDIDRDEAAWERWKNAHGRNGVRAARVLFLQGALVLLAGLVDLGRGAFRRRGAALALLGVAMMAVFALRWADREAAFVREVARANAGLGAAAAPLPASWPGAVSGSAE